MNNKTTKKNKSDIELLNVYKDLYTANMSELNSENNLRWTIFILYLTVILSLVGYAFYENELILFFGVLVIHIGWFYGITAKILLLMYCEFNGKYLEMVINRIVRKLDNVSVKPKVIRFTDLYLKLQGNYRTPLRHLYSGFIYLFYSIPAIIYIGINIYILFNYCNLKTDIIDIPLYINGIILGFFFIIIVLITIFFKKAINKMFIDFSELIKEYKFLK